MRTELVTGSVLVLAAVASCGRGRGSSTSKASNPSDASNASRAVCGPIPAARGAALRYGPEGGNLRPFAIEIFADGRVQGTATSAQSAPRVDPQAVARLVAAAHDSGFWALPANPVRSPTSNPDESRIAVTVQSTCGSHSTAYPLSDAPPAFRRLIDELAAATGVTP